MWAGGRWLERTYREKRAKEKEISPTLRPRRRTDWPRGAWWLSIIALGMHRATVAPRDQRACTLNLFESLKNCRNLFILQSTWHTLIALHLCEEPALVAAFAIGLYTDRLYIYGVRALHTRQRFTSHSCSHLQRKRSNKSRLWRPGKTVQAEKAGLHRDHTFPSRCPRIPLPTNMREVVTTTCTCVSE